jgi:ADP-heptose:LPS heptosyltransferase
VILALRALGVGDLLTAVPALRALAAAFPGDRRMLASPASLMPLVELLDLGYEGVDVPAWVGGRGLPAMDVADRLPRGSIAVNLHGRGPESSRLLLATRPQRLIAFAHPAVPETWAGPAWEAHPPRSGSLGPLSGPRMPLLPEHEVVRWCRLLSESGIPADPGALDLPRPPGVVRDPWLTVIHPGAASAARRWPAERWAAVARAERAAGRRVAITGSPAEVRLARQVAALADAPLECVVAGRTNLRDLIELVATAGRVACGDTGVAHLATALRTPSVVLFGPTSPRVWGPPPNRPWHRALWAGRSGDPHAETPDPGLLAIATGDVLAALEQLPFADLAGVPHRLPLFPAGRRSLDPSERWLRWRRRFAT